MAFRITPLHGHPENGRYIAELLSRYPSKGHCVVSLAVAGKRAWCSAARLGTARRKHRFPYCCVACLQTSVSLRLMHGVNTSQYAVSSVNICVKVKENTRLAIVVSVRLVDDRINLNGLDNLKVIT
jgi:hypothetical protein